MVLASSTLVNVAEDAELRLIGLLAESAPSGAASMQGFQEQCNRCISAGDATGLVQAVINSKPSALDTLVALPDVDEAVAAFSLLTALLKRVQKDQPDAEAGLAKSLATTVINASSSSTDENSSIERKVALLSVLYNMRSNANEKVLLLEQMTSLAGKNPVLLQPEAVLGKFYSIAEEDGSFNAQNVMSSMAKPPVVTLLDSWNVSLVDRRSLYVTVTQVLKDPIRKQQFLLYVVDTYANTDATAVDAAGIAAAKEAAIGAIRDPVALFQQQRSLLHKPPTQALKQKEPALYGLLEVFQEGKFSDYEMYCSKHGGEAKAITGAFPELDAATCQRYMRILSLCSLAVEHEEIPYKEIAETLQLTDDSNIESWVIAAVNSGLLQAKMDQLSRQVMVERCVVRRFDMDKWTDLQKRLTVWKQNVGGILAALKQSQQAAAATTIAAAAAATK